MTTKFQEGQRVRLINNAGSPWSDTGTIVGVRYDGSGIVYDFVPDHHRGTTTRTRTCQCNGGRADGSGGFFEESLEAIWLPPLEGVTFD